MAQAHCREIYLLHGSALSAIEEDALRGLVCKHTDADIAVCVHWEYEEDDPHDYAALILEISCDASEEDVGKLTKDIKALADDSSVPHRLRPWLRSARSGPGRGSE